MSWNKVVWLERGLFPIYYGFCPNERAWRREVAKLGMRGEPYPQDERQGGTVSTFTKDCKVACLMTIHDRYDRRSQDVNDRAALFCHEAAHIWQAARERMGEDKPSHEFEAYGLQFIVGNLLDAYTKTRLTKRKKPRPPKRKRRARRSRH